MSWNAMSSTMKYVWPNGTHSCLSVRDPCGHICPCIHCGAWYDPDNKNHCGAPYVPRNIVSGTPRDTPLKMVHCLITEYLSQSYLRTNIKWYVHINNEGITIVITRHNSQQQCNYDTTSTDKQQAFKSFSNITHQRLITSPFYYLFFPSLNYSTWTS